MNKPFDPKNDALIRCVGYVRTDVPVRAEVEHDFVFPRLATRPESLGMKPQRRYLPGQQPLPFQIIRQSEHGRWELLLLHKREGSPAGSTMWCHHNWTFLTDNALHSMSMPMLLGISLETEEDFVMSYHDALDKSANEAGVGHPHVLWIRKINDGADVAVTLYRVVVNVVTDAPIAVSLPA